MSKSSPEAKAIPQDDNQKELRITFRYTGTSMKSTFRIGGVLYVRPDVQDAKPGDVVVYEQEGRYIVHRVLSVGEDGYITRGDDNRFADPTLIAHRQIIGRVELREHQGAIASVQGGSRGLWLARLSFVGRRLEPSLRIAFGWPYRLLKVSRIMPRIWRPAIQQIHLKTDAGTLVKYIYRQKTVAVWEASQRRFECRKPFDLVISPPEELK